MNNIFAQSLSAWVLYKDPNYFYKAYCSCKSRIKIKYFWGLNFAFERQFPIFRHHFYWIEQRRLDSGINCSSKWIGDSFKNHSNVHQSDGQLVCYYERGMWPLKGLLCIKTRWHDGVVDKIWLRQLYHTVESLSTCEIIGNKCLTSQ